MSILFIADLHLDYRDDQRLEKVERFFNAIKSGSTVYLLGDIFEYWIGKKFIQNGCYSRFLKLLRKTVDMGVSMNFIHGNRDYLVDSFFGRATGVKVLGISTVINIDGKLAYLTHGDFIFNENPLYFAYRRVARSCQIRDVYSLLPPGPVISVAEVLRYISGYTTKELDWSEEKLIKRAGPIFDRGYDYLICGHIHKAQKLSFSYRGKERQLITLSESQYARFEGSTIKLLSVD